jgi:hypothetical protein
VSDPERDPLATALAGVDFDYATVHVGPESRQFDPGGLADWLVRQTSVVALAAPPAELPTAPPDDEARPWPTLADFRQMSPSEVNRFLASRGLSLRVRDDEPPTAPDASLRDAALRKAAQKVIDFINGGGVVDLWPNASGLNELRAALRPPTSETPPRLRADTVAAMEGMPPEKVAEWTAEVLSQRRATSETPDPLPLDVALLAEAIWEMSDNSEQGPWIDASEDQRATTLEWVNEVAAEYVRLAAVRGSE